MRLFWPEGCVSEGEDELQDYLSGIMIVALITENTAEVSNTWREAVCTHDRALQHALSVGSSPRRLFFPMRGVEGDEFCSSLWMITGPIMFLLSSAFQTAINFHSNDPFHRPHAV